MFLSTRARAVLVFTLFLLPLAAVAADKASPPPGGRGGLIKLDGQWRLELDRRDLGIPQRWFARELTGKVNLPGTLTAQGIGDDVTLQTEWTGSIIDRSWFTSPRYEKYRTPGNLKVPFWLQPTKYYAGAAWYQREIEIPPDWKGRHAVLFLERPHGQTHVWLDDREVASLYALGTPHEYEMGLIQPGRHSLTVRLDNRMVVDVGPNSHSVSDHTQGNWNGIVGRMELRSTPPIWIDDVQVYPSNDGSVRVSVALRKDEPLGDMVEVEVVIRDRSSGLQVARANKTVRVMDMIRDDSPGHRQLTVTGATCELVAKLNAPPRLWDEFSPALYVAEVHLVPQDPARADSAKTTFGFCELKTQGTQFVLNGHKAFFRGTLECCIFPRTGHPPVDVEEWKRIIGVCKAHGLNMIRFHSWCPPEAAFVAADEMGFYFQVECSSWANTTTGLGLGKPIDKWIYEEADRILRHYGNHPSFLLLLYGNEPGGKHQAFLGKWVEHYKAKDPRRLVAGGAGWPEIPANQFHVSPGPRVQAWGQGLKSRINARPPETRTDYRDYVAKRTVPVISHEIGQWCVYPNFEEIPKYTGYLKPRNFEIFRDFLDAAGMGKLARDFLIASGKLQALCYKEEIESALRTPGMGGFQLLDLHDFPGQGTALVGVLDPFWEFKGYVTAEEYRRFCGPTVPLARLDKRVFTTDETLAADVEMAHFGPAPLKGAQATWRLVGDDGKAAAEGTLPARDVPIDNGTALGSIRIDLRDVPSPARYKLVVSLPAAKAENDWDVWVYPAKVQADPPAGVTVAIDLDEKALAALKDGGKVLLLVPPKLVKSKVALGFSSIFWNTAWTRGQAPHTLGILCDPKNPALAAFPTDSHSNWQWWYLVSRAGAMVLDEMPDGLAPIVRVIDDWFTARPLALALEVRCGGGSLLVCSIDLSGDLGDNPVARQLRASLLAYMGRPAFQPKVEVTVDQVRGMMTGPAAMRRLGARVAGVSSFEEGYEGDKAIDGDVSTMWHTRWTGDLPPFPHEIRIALDKPATIHGVRLTPRQDNNLNGTIKDYELYVSADGKNWDKPVAKGALSKDFSPKTVELSKPATGRYVRLVVLSGHATKGTWASLAELELDTSVEISTAEIIRLLERESIARIFTTHAQVILIGLSDGQVFFGTYKHAEAGKYASDPELSDVGNLVSHILARRPKDQVKGILIAGE
mgnify:CR=1 FL=1